MSDRETLAGHLELQALGSEALGSPFYRDLERAMADDTRAGGPVWGVLGPFAAAPFDAVYPLRLLGGVHRLVLAGGAPDLAVHFPSVGGDGDAAAAMTALRTLLRDPPPSVLDALTRPPQTNEVGRSGALVPGMLVVARDTGLPLRLLELGSSAGLNLRVDGYRYEADGVGWGEPGSPVRFTDLWAPGRPPFAAAARIVERRGCDRDPIDAADPEAALTLLGYVWPGQDARFSLLRAALDVARDRPVTIDRADADAWVAEQLASPAPGVATVVYHSVVWQYLDAATRAGIRASLARAGERATRDAPVAWLRLEPPEDGGFPPELRLTLWDGGAPAGEERLLATTGYHGGPVTWPAP